MKTAALQGVIGDQTYLLVPFFIKIKIFFQNTEYLCGSSFASLVKIQTMVHVAFHGIAPV